jgi:hypothetical protein
MDKFISCHSCTRLINKALEVRYIYKMQDDNPYLTENKRITTVICQKCYDELALSGGIYRGYGLYQRYDPQLTRKKLQQEYRQKTCYVM